MNSNKIQQIINYQNSIEKYLNNLIYSFIELMNSTLIIILQMLSCINLYEAREFCNGFIIILTFIIAYIITDFVNGFVHMVMDNNTNYNSIIGPFVAAFHMHHAKPKYQKKNFLHIYFFESGTKFWLTGFLCCVIYLQYFSYLSFKINLGLVLVGILSSVAELSHYWCHTASAKNSYILKLQKYHLLLNKKYHSTHHKFDNIQYAFLNGISDPFLNKISVYLYSGYKNNADIHCKAYIKNNIE